MHIFKLFISTFILQAALVMSFASPFSSFLLQSSTSKRTGPPPEEEKPQSGVLGVPGQAVQGAPAAPQNEEEQGADDQAQPNMNRSFDPRLRQKLREMIDRRQRGRGEPSNGGEEGENAGTTASTAPQKSETSISKRGSGVTLTFKNASIEEVVDVIMKELGYSYILDPQVTGTVNLFTQQEFARDKLFGVLEQLLKMNGQAIIRQDDLYVIVPIAQSPTIPGAILKRPTTPAPARREGQEAAPGASPEQQPESSTPPAGGPGNPTVGAVAQQPGGQPTNIQVPEVSANEQLSQAEGVITYIVPLHYIPSSEMVTMIKAFVSDGAQVVDFQSANILLITDYRANIRQTLELIRLLDTEYFDLNTVDLVPVRYHQAVDVAEDLGQIFAPGDKAGGVRIVAIERLNSILVVTHAPEVFQEVVRWINKLDAPSGGSNIRTFVYAVENNTAANIAEILGQLYSDGAGLPSGGGSKSGEETEQQTSRRQQPRGDEGTFRRDENAQGRIGSTGLPLGPSLGGRSAESGVRAAVVTGDIKIIVNEFNNSLIIQGTEADYQFLRETIEQLDVLPRQVLIEAKIYSVELRNDLSYGVSWFLQDRLAPEDLGHPTTGSISPSTSEGGGGLSAATRIFIGNSRQLDVLFDALRTKTNVEILENPTLLVVDGTEAQINVGAEVPVTTASFGDPLRSGSNVSFVNSISFRPTGTTLLLLPRISASGIVTMDLAIEVSNASGPALTPTINRNFVRTSLIARDQQQIAIAGVISDSHDVGKERVPLLGDIPGVGALFGSTTRNKRRFELVFLITPHVVRNLPTAVELSLDFRRALRNAYDFINRKEQEEKDIRKMRRQEEAAASSSDQ